MAVVDSVATLQHQAPLLDVKSLAVHYRTGRSGLRLLGSAPPPLRALDGVDLQIERGVSLGIVGESGCGKSTLARAICGLVPPTAGEIRYRGVAMERKRTRSDRRRIQMVFQDPGSSLNPRMRIGVMLREVVEVHGLASGAAARARAGELIELVGLPLRLLDKTPGQLSGGQRQRVGIARALAVEPELLIADESVSALDVSVQAAILNLLVDLQQRLNLTMVLIAHDLAVVRNTCDRTAVMYLGRVVEAGATAQLFTNAQHPYTRALLAAAPRLNGQSLAANGPALAGEPPSPTDIPSGCRFHPRCPLAQNVCRTDETPIVRRGEHLAACRYAWASSATPDTDAMIKARQ